MASLVHMCLYFLLGDNNNINNEPIPIHTDTPPPLIQEQQQQQPKEKEEPKVQVDEGDDIALEQFPPSNLVVTEKDCLNCEEIECEEHQQYPSYLELDSESRLLGTMKPYNRHFLISTAQSDWPPRIEEDYGTLAANLQALLINDPLPWKTTVTNTSLISTHATTVYCGMDIIIQPENILVGNVSPDDAQLVYDLFAKMPLPTSDDEVFDIDTFKKNNDLQELDIYPNPYDSMILICSHRKRDKRCGVTAPILNREFDHILRELDIPDGEGGTVVMMVSHVGGNTISIILFTYNILIHFKGHKYAGNVICYINKGKTGIWYGRVKTCHCRAIIEETILQGKVIKELYRGSMKYSFGDPSKSKCSSSRLKW